LKPTFPAHIGQQRRNLIKQAKALGKGKEIHTWLRRYLKERRRGV